MDRLRDFVSGIVAQAPTSLMPAVATVHAENAVWRAGRFEWDAAMWEALQAAQADPQRWEDLPNVVRGARERAYAVEIGGWDGITYRPEES